MAQTYFLLPTADGEAKLANAQALSVPLKLTAIAVGDGNGVLPVPSRDRKTLVNEQRRAAINTIIQDPANASQIIAEQIIPESAGGWWIREAGIFDEAGTLIYYANVPETYKPVLAEGSARTQVLRLVCLVTSGATVELKVDPSIVLATRSYVDTKVSDELDKRDAKQSVYVATTAPLASLSGLPAIDGQPLVAGARVLVKNQTAAKDNGIYIATAGNWARSNDFDSGLDVTPGITVPVEQGATQSTSVWHLTTQGAIIIGATPLSFKRQGEGYFAPVASPDFSGPVLVDAPAAGANARQATNVAWVNSAISAAISALVAAAPGQLDTINELAAALGNDANFAANMTALLALKANLASPALTGTPTAPTPALFDATTKLATMEALQRALGNYNGAQGINDSWAVPANLVGKLFNVSLTAGGKVVTLPLLSGVPDGATVAFQSMATVPFTIQRAGTSDVISANGTTVTSVVIKPGDTAFFTRIWNGAWAFSGSAALGMPGSGAFKCSLGINGFAYLPTGMILQWVEATVPHNVLQYRVNLPIVFPNAAISAWGSIGSGIFVNGVDRSIGVDGSTTQALITIQSTNSGSSGARAYVLGY